MSWSKIVEGESKLGYTKFGVGVTEIQVLDMIPHVRWSHWVQSLNKGKGGSVTCPGPGCPICAIRKQQKQNKEPITYNMSKKFSLNILNLNSGNSEVLEQGPTFMGDLADLIDELMEDGKIKDPRKAIIQVTRKGTNKNDTKYRFKLKETVEEVPGHEIVDFKEYYAPKTIDEINELISAPSIDLK